MFHSLFSKTYYSDEWILKCIGTLYIASPIFRFYDLLFNLQDIIPVQKRYVELLFSERVPFHFKYIILELSSKTHLIWSYAMH